MKKGPEEKPVIRRATQFHNSHLSSYAMGAVEIGNPGLPASTATQDNAHQQPLTALLHSRYD